jgi:hypothetical protein
MADAAGPRNRLPTHCTKGESKAPRAKVSPNAAKRSPAPNTGVKAPPASTGIAPTANPAL